MLSALFFFHSFSFTRSQTIKIESSFKDLGLDSLDAVELVMGFEEEFGVEITDDAADKIFSGKDAVKTILGLNPK